MTHGYSRPGAGHRSRDDPPAPPTLARSLPSVPDMSRRSGSRAAERQSGLKPPHSTVTIFVISLGSTIFQLLLNSDSRAKQV